MALRAAATRAVLAVAVSAVAFPARAGATVFHAHPTSDGAFCDCVRRISAPGDECRFVAPG